MASIIPTGRDPLGGGALAGLLGEGVAEQAELATDAVSDPVEVVGRLDRLDSLGIRVVPDLEALLKGIGKVPHLLLGLLEGLGDEVDGLVVCDRVLLQAGRRWLESLVLGRVLELAILALARLVGQAVLQFTEGGQQPGPVGLELALLPADPELDLCVSRGHGVGGGSSRWWSVKPAHSASGLRK